MAWSHVWALTVACGLLGLTRLALAQPSPAFAGGGEGASGAPTAAVDPNVVKALTRMGAFLRAQKAVAITAEVATDDVDASGQKVQLGSVVELKVRRPDRLRADIESDTRSQQMFYDGKSFTLFGRRVGYYASFPAPPTLVDFVDVAEQKYGIELPLADLFHWGTDPTQAAVLQQARNVGTASINGTLCDHYALRQAGFDWQIWIERGARPLPRKLVITTTSEVTRPQHAVVYTWKLNQRFDEQLFTFVPPPTAHRIAFDVPGEKGAQP